MFLCLSGIISLPDLVFLFFSGITLHLVQCFCSSSGIILYLVQCFCASVAIFFATGTIGNTEYWKLILLHSKAGKPTEKVSLRNHTCKVTSRLHHTTISSIPVFPAHLYNPSIGGSLLSSGTPAGCPGCNPPTSTHARCTTVESVYHPAYAIPDRHPFCFIAAGDLSADHHIFLIPAINPLLPLRWPSMMRWCCHMVGVLSRKAYIGTGSSFTTAALLYISSTILQVGKNNGAIGYALCCWERCWCRPSQHLYR